MNVTVFDSFYVCFLGVRIACSRKLFKSGCFLEYLNEAGIVVSRILRIRTEHSLTELKLYSEKSRLNNAPTSPAKLREYEEAVVASVKDLGKVKEEISASDAFEAIDVLVGKRVMREMMETGKKKN